MKFLRRGACRWLVVLALGLGGLSGVSLAAGTYSPFIYFRF